MENVLFKDKASYKDDFGNSDEEAAPDAYLERVKAEGIFCRLFQMLEVTYLSGQVKKEMKTTTMTMMRAQMKISIQMRLKSGTVTSLKNLIATQVQVLAMKTKMVPVGFTSKQRMNFCNWLWITDGGQKKKEKKKKATKAPSSKPSKRREKKEKDENKPKRASTAFMIWLNASREQIKKDNPGIKVTEIAKKGGEMWREMKDKSEWEKKAAKEKEEYTKAMAEYVASGGKYKANDIWSVVPLYFFFRRCGLKILHLQEYSCEKNN